MINKFKNISTEQFKKTLGITAIALAGFTATGIVHADTTPNPVNDVAQITQQVNFDDLTFHEMNFSQRKQAKSNIESKFQSKLRDYQSLGLYNKVDDAIFKITINSFQGDNAHYDSQMISLNMNLKSSVNNFFLKDKEFKVKGASEEFNEQYDLEKTFTHELGHLQFTKNPNLTNDSKLNEVMLSDINLGVGEKSINTSYQYLQENVADVYGELAYLKKNGFSEESIKTVQSDIDVKIQDQIYLQKEHPNYGSNFDSHDTASSLKTLNTMLKDPGLKEKISHMSASKYDDLAKGIVLNSYIDYVKSPEIQKNIQINLQSKLDESSIEKYTVLSQLNHPKVDLINLVNSLDNENNKINSINKISSLRAKFNTPTNPSSLKLN